MAQPRQLARRQGPHAVSEGALPIEGPLSLPLKAAMRTHVGRVRSEDAAIMLPDEGLFVVADGMGGLAAGAVAARAVIEQLPGLLRVELSITNRASDQVESAVREAVACISRELRKGNGTRRSRGSMGTTLVMALLYEGVSHIAHVGDSRAYLFRNRELLPMTDDHSVVGALLRSGDITAEQARRHPARSMLTRYIGMDAAVCCDVRHDPLQAEDRLLLCTDGLTGMVTENDIRGILQDTA
ncbi:MAG: PP2C family protein-serine/threonine phosphatase, partial [Candidatus Xenobia bacterium]